MNALASQSTTFLSGLCSFISLLLNIYSFAIIIRIMLSWFPQQPVYNMYGQPQSQQRPVYDFLRKITDPYLNLFRSRKLTLGMLDFSTLIALMVLYILKSLCSTVAIYGTITLGIVLGVIVQGVWEYVIKYFLLILLVILGIRWCKGRRNGGYGYTATLDSILAGPVNFVFRVFYKKTSVSPQKLVGTAFFFYLAIYIVLRYVFSALVPLLYSM